MVKGKDESRDISERSFRLEICETITEEPTPIDPPKTPDMRAMPELYIPLPPSTPRLDVSASKWKRLIGTPSKPPVPENIYVPDPSPSSSISNDSDDSSCSTILPSSSQSSFAHPRRQGEYVQRPPVWKVYKLEDDIPCPQDGVDDAQIGTDCSMKDIEFYLNHRGRGFGDGKPSFQNLSWTGFGVSGESIDKKLKKMADVFMDKPLTVKMMQNRDLPQLPRRSYQGDEVHHPEPPVAPPTETSASGATPMLSPVPETPASGSIPVSSSNVETPAKDGPRRPDSLEIQQAPILRDDKGKGRASDVSNPGTGNFRRRSTNPSIEPNTNRSSRDQGYSASSYCDSHESNMPKIYNSALDPKRYCHFEFPKTEKNKDFIDEYLDIRVPPPTEGNESFQNSIIVGSHVTFIGRTEFENSHGRACEVGLPMYSQFYVERIFGDCWALCIKLEPGLEIATKRKSRSLGGLRKLLPPKDLRAGIQLVPLKNHPVIVVFAPLCALTLMSNFGVFQLHLYTRKQPMAKSTTFEGGLVKAAPRNSSERFELDAKKTRVVWVSERVYSQYKNFCDAFQEKPDSLFEYVAGLDIPEAKIRESPTLTENVRGLGYDNTPEAMGRESSKRDTVASGNATFQRCKKMFSQRKHRAPVDVPPHEVDEPATVSIPSNKPGPVNVPSHEMDERAPVKLSSHKMDEPTVNPNHIFSNVNPFQQEKVDKPVASPGRMSSPPLVGISDTAIGDPNGKPISPKHPDVDLRLGDADSIITDEWAGEDDSQSGFIQPTWHRPDEAEIRLDDTLPGSDDIPDANHESNQDSPKNYPRRLSRADPISTDSRKRKGRKNKGRSIASRFVGRSWRKTNEQGKTPKTQDPGTASARKSSDGRLVDSFISLLKPRRRARPSILPQNSGNGPKISHHVVFSLENENGPSTKSDNAATSLENLQTVSDFDLGLDAGIITTEGSRQRFSRAWKSFNSRPVSQSSIITNPWAKDENRYISIEQNRDRPIQMESSSHAGEAQPVLSLNCNPPDSQGLSYPLVTPASADPDAEALKPWDGMGERECSRILRELVEEAGPTPVIRERLVAWKTRESDPGMEAETNEVTRKMVDEISSERLRTK